MSTHNALEFISAGCAYCSTASVPVGVAAVTRTSALRRCDSARILLLNSVSATVQVNPRCLQAQGARAFRSSLDHRKTVDSEVSHVSHDLVASEAGSERRVPRFATCATTSSRARAPRFATIPSRADVRGRASPRAPDLLGRRAVGKGPTRATCAGSRGRPALGEVRHVSMLTCGTCFWAANATFSRLDASLARVEKGLRIAIFSCEP